MAPSIDAEASAKEATMNAPESTLSRLALAAAAQGLRTLAPGQALSLHPREAGELQVARGTAWVTFDVPARGAPRAPLGDLFVPAGGRLPLRPGQRLVIEPIALRGQPPAPLVFSWQAASARRPAGRAGGPLGTAAPACA